MNRIRINGKYRDSLTDTTQQVFHHSGIRSNLIVDGCGVTLAALVMHLANEDNKLFLAVGSGAPGWDTSPPVPPPDTKKLYKEILRRKISAQEIYFLTEKKKPVKKPTCLLEIHTVFTSADFNLPEVTLREFGLIGYIGETPFLLNYVVHPKILISGTTNLKRKLNLDFNPAPEAGNNWSFGMEQPVILLDGIDKAYTGRLEKKGVKKIKDLIALDPFTEIENLPHAGLIEIQTRARLLKNRTYDFSPFHGLAKQTLTEILNQPPASLCKQAGMEKVTPLQVKELQEELAVFQLAFGNAFLKELAFEKVLEETGR